MYGYVRPLKGELKVSEYEAYHQLYCGLCHALKKRGGFFARFVVNYDFTFLAMLLWRGDKPVCKRQSCPARLGMKGSCIEENDALLTAADYSIILAWWKLEDSICDSGLCKALLFRMLRPLLRPAYKTAAACRPSFAETVQEQIEALRKLEDEHCGNLDAAADTFACILRAAAEAEPDASRRRILEQLLYHLGRMVYILDAADDLPEDIRSGAYNPLRYRFSLKDGKLSDADTEILRQSLRLSQNALASALELLEKGAWSSVTENTVFYGLPWTTEAVLCGEWRRIQMQKSTRQEKV